MKHADHLSKRLAAMKRTHPLLAAIADELIADGHDELLAWTRAESILRTALLTDAAPRQHTRHPVTLPARHTALRRTFLAHRKN